MEKMSQDEFIRKVIEKHKDDGYDYSEVVYINSNTPVNIICPKHGMFSQTPHNHLAGQGCPECGKEKNTKKRAKTAEQFIEDAGEVHGDKYDYSMVEYINNKVAVAIKCHQCGKIFKQSPNRHLKGEGCPQCALKSRAAKRSLTYEKFIEKAVAKHGDKYDYSDIVYKNENTKVTIKCRQCGKTFEQTPHSHLSGCGCRSCSYKHRARKQTYSREKFIEKARKVHGNLYDYKDVVYKNSHIAIKIYCHTCGKYFEQTPTCHLNGSGCPTCANKRTAEKLSSDVETFIAKAKEIHGDKYDYSNVEYVNNYTRVLLICNTCHKEFLIRPQGHLVGKGCSVCAKKRVADKQRDTTETFTKKAETVHGKGRYDYSEVDYRESSSKVIIKCNKCGHVFTQTPNKHLGGCGCPLCGMHVSHHEEDILSFIRSMGIEAEQSNRSVLKRQELDIFIPSKNIAIEYDGLYWHSDAQGKRETYHLNKTQECEKNGVRLIHIFEDEWLKKRKIVESRLQHILGKDKGRRIYARQCEIRNVNAKECAEFLDNNHLQGNCQSKFRYGLYYNDELVATMTFGRRRQKRDRIKGYDEQWEMLRFCCKNNVSVVGGASRFLKHFIKEEKPKTIITYADKRWSDGELYFRLGFTHTHDSRPNYFYVVEKDRESRFKYRKSELVRQGFDESKTEKEIMEEREIPRIYDCGNMVFRLDL